MIFQTAEITQIFWLPSLFCSLLHTVTFLHIQTKFLVCKICYTREVKFDQESLMLVLVLDQIDTDL